VDERKVRAVARKIEAALSDFCFVECQTGICEGCLVDAALRYVRELMLSGPYVEELTPEQRAAIRKPCRHLTVLPGGRKSTWQC